MTSSRVNLRVPPRLIESARAAQYANRETFGARTAQERIAREVNRRVEAEQRAAPGRDPQRGGLADYGKRRMPRPARIRRRIRSQWSVNGVFVYLLSTVHPNVAPLPGDVGIKTRTKVLIGSGDGSVWRIATDRFRITSNVIALPLAEGTVVLVGHASWDLSDDQRVVVVGYVVTLTDVREIAVPDAFARLFFKPSWDDASGVDEGVLTGGIFLTELGRDIYDFEYMYGAGYVQSSQFSNPVLLPAVSSSVYDRLALPAGSVLYAQDALRLYGAELPVLGSLRYRTDIDQLLYYGDTFSMHEFDGTYGIMDDLSVTSDQLPNGPFDPIAPRLTPVVLTETVERKVAVSALPVEVPADTIVDSVSYFALGLVSQIITYDYHGGSYCQDRLAQLGLTL